jgi:hypothetical protein
VKHASDEWHLLRARRPARRQRLRCFLRMHSAAAPKKFPSFRAKGGNMETFLAVMEAARAGGLSAQAARERQRPGARASEPAAFRKHTKLFSLHHSTPPAAHEVARPPISHRLIHPLSSHSAGIVVLASLGAR